LAGAVLLTAAGDSIHLLWEQEIQPGDLTRSLLAQHLGDTFFIQSETSSNVVLQLSHIRGLGDAESQHANVRLEYSFSVLFRGPVDRSLAQGTYQFSHRKIGSFPLFIVPMAPTADARYYEAVFNQQPM
jgi:hypothetical protein